MEPEHRPDEEDCEEDRDAPTSVAFVPDALLQQLRDPKRAAPTLPPPPDSTVDEDQSQTLVAAGAGKVQLHAPRVPGGAARNLPLPRPPSQSRPQLEKFEQQTEDSPDEDPSETMMGAQISQSVMRHLSQRPPPPTAAADVEIPPPPGPMFAPPTADMFDPPPADSPVPANIPAASAPLAPTVPTSFAPARRLGGLLIAMTLALLVAAAAYWFYFRARF